jgi:hypothetical protein
MTNKIHILITYRLQANKIHILILIYTNKITLEVYIDNLYIQNDKIYFVVYINNLYIY